MASAISARGGAAGSRRRAGRSRPAPPSSARGRRRGALRAVPSGRLSAQTGPADGLSTRSSAPQTTNVGWRTVGRIGRTSPSSPWMLSNRARRNGARSRAWAASTSRAGPGISGSPANTRSRSRSYSARVVGTSGFTPAARSESSPLGSGAATPAGSRSTSRRTPSGSREATSVATSPPNELPTRSAGWSGHVRQPGGDLVGQAEGAVEARPGLGAAVAGEVGHEDAAARGQRAGQTPATRKPPLFGAEPVDQDERRLGPPAVRGRPRAGRRRCVSRASSPASARRSATTASTATRLTAPQPLAARTNSERASRRMGRGEGVGRRRPGDRVRDSPGATPGLRWR